MRKLVFRLAFLLALVDAFLLNYFTFTLSTQAYSAFSASKTADWMYLYFGLFLFFYAYTIFHAVYHIISTRQRPMLWWILFVLTPILIGSYLYFERHILPGLGTSAKQTDRIPRSALDLMNRTLASVAAAIVIVPRFFAGGSSGFSLHLSDGQNHFAGGTSSWALVGSLLCVLLFWFASRSKPTPYHSATAQPIRRALASALDIILALFLPIGILGLLFPFIESLWTGQFSLYFARDYIRQTDALSVAVVLIAWVAFILVYFGYPLRTRRQTIGSYIAGIVAIPTTDGSLSWGGVIARVLLVQLATIGFPITLLIGRDSKGRYWHDKVSDFVVLRAGYPIAHPTPIKSVE